MNTKTSEASKTISDMASPSWHLANELANENQPVMIYSGQEQPTLKVIFDNFLDISNRLQDNDYTSIDVQQSAQNLLVHDFKQAVAQVGLLPVPGFDKLPLERILRRANKLDIDLGPSINQGLNNHQYEANEQLASFTRKSLELGKPEIALSVISELNSIGKSHLLSDEESNSKAFLGALNSVVNASNSSEMQRLQKSLVGVLEKLPIDTDLELGAFSISEYCEGEPALSMITSRLSHYSANKIIDDAVASTPEDESTVVFGSANRTF